MPCRLRALYGPERPQAGPGVGGLARSRADGAKAPRCRARRPWDVVFHHLLPIRQAQGRRSAGERASAQGARRERAGRLRQRVDVPEAGCTKARGTKRPRSSRGPSCGFGFFQPVLCGRQIRSFQSNTMRGSFLTTPTRTANAGCDRGRLRPAGPRARPATEALTLPRQSAPRVAAKCRRP